ncbi:NADP-dependent 3-hydroxy acid dehydrogenase YdfG [Hephaestia caeni]|uniref:NADP-dependent 3-hydroxy acid dehydrogenase YdfG n=1 Tax=Hephaestia caeni TaxID=645617 RepID=A0A397NQJ5_9SPHN|nr:SDR family NAD(P)-dependent oxidoreductase [Hephaestia caeni]RIA37973.1 NADP-dependent 3-hydroxy acid dehydrogenase YdfG [Hephaestia caeni]
MIEQTHQGRVVLITGASSGLGEQFATMLAARGARAVVGARRVERLAALVDRIERDGGAALAVALDVTDEASVRAAYDAAEQRFGLVDTVIANAGINAEGPATDLSVEDFDAIHAVNVRGVFLTAREGGKRLLAAGEAAARGRIVILASMGGLHVLPGLVAYCASKAAAVMLAKGLAKEWVRSGISVNAVCPGYMMTEINADWFTSDAGRRMTEKLPRRRLMPIDALSATIAHLTSDGGAHVTGSTIEIHDGQVI